MNKSKKDKLKIQFADLASVLDIEGVGEDADQSELSEREVSTVVESIVSGELTVWNCDEEECLGQVSFDLDSMAVDGLVDSNGPDVGDDFDEDEDESPDEDDDS